MVRKEMLYRMAVAGSFAGLLSWFIGVWVFAFITLSDKDQWIAEMIDSSLIGMLIGISCIPIADKLNNRRAGLGRTLGLAFIGLAGGGSAGVAGVFVSQLIRTHWMKEWPVAGILLAWCLTGAFIGLVMGIIRYLTLIPHILLSLVGGLFGASVGGVILISVGERIPYFTRSVGLMFTGLSICFCSTLAAGLARRARLLFNGSGDVTANRILTGREWELLPRSKVLFGREKLGPQGVDYIHVADRKMAPQHAWIEWEEGAFKIYAHDKNINPGGMPIWKLEAGSPPTTVMGRYKLNSGDEIHMGQSRFTFLSQGKSLFESASGERDKSDHPNSRAASAKVSLLILALAVGLLATPLFAQSGEMRLIPAEIQLMRVREASEAPAFRLLLNVVDAQGNPQKIHVSSPDQAMKAVQVFENDKQLRVCHVAPGSLPQRYAVLLVDVSGSMLQPASNGRTKFDVMKEACLRFTEDFTPGVDHIAVIPFHSHDVVKGVNEARFFDDKSDLTRYIDKFPSSKNNTGLFSAVRAALGRLQTIKAEQGSDAQCLLLVLTDGANYVAPGDDPGLLTSPESVVSLASQLGIQIITVGFGNDQNLNEIDLRKLALPQNSNYYRARRPEELVRYFQQARLLQLDRVRVTFLPQQELFSSLVYPHQYRIRFQADGGKPIETTVEWIPSAVPVPEGVLPADERGCIDDKAGYDLLWPTSIFSLFFILHAYLYFRLPERLWADEKDSLILKQRAMELLE